MSRLAITTCLNIVILSSICFNVCAQNKQADYNLNFEELDSLSRPMHWKIPSAAGGGFLMRLDSTIRQEGKYSLEISKTGKGNFGTLSSRIGAPIAGQRLTLTGYVKTQDVMNGYAGLWLRFDDRNEAIIAYDDMRKRGITGTSDWKEYTIELPYNPARAVRIDFGAYLAGDGRMWVDNLNLSVDGKPVEGVVAKPLLAPEDNIDSITREKMQTASESLSRNFSLAKVDQLADLCKIWGFLKYYHPAVGKGTYDWDSTLFSLLPEVVTATSRHALLAQEKLIDGLGDVMRQPAGQAPGSADKDRKKPEEVTIKMQPDYGGLFAIGHLPKDVMNKLAFIRDNRGEDANSYYAGQTQGVGSVVVRNENFYGNNPYPSAAVRLVGLFRYWNLIQYYFPYRYLISEDWNKVLVEFIPRMVKAANKQEYLLTWLELIGHVHDTHASVWGPKVEMDSIKGQYITPFQAKFIEGRLVVTGYYVDSPDVRPVIQKGDIIEKIDGMTVEVLVKKYLPLTPASNMETQLRDMPSYQGFLLRSNKRTVELAIRHGDEQRQVAIQRVPLSNIKGSIDYMAAPESPAYKLIRPDIGYINPGKLKESDLNEIRRAFAGTRGIIVDLRCYPSTFMPFSYGSWLKEDKSPFVCFTTFLPRTPGAFSISSPLSNGGKDRVNGGKDSLMNFTYKGKLILIVNAITQSQAEYTTMALQSVAGAVVVGSTTAGADGNVTMFSLPGGIETMFSGIGIYYPDRGETQRVGVRIDVPVHPTIKGIKEGRDEYLEAAIDQIH